MAITQLLYEIGHDVRSGCTHRKCPPSAAVRHRRIASSTLTCFQPIHWRFRSTKAAPAVRMRSAISSAAGSLEHLLHNVTHTYIKTAWQSLLRSLMRSVRRRRLTSITLYRTSDGSACSRWSESGFSRVVGIELLFTLLSPAFHGATHCQPNQLEPKGLIYTKHRVTEGMASPVCSVHASN